MRGAFGDNPVIRINCPLAVTVIVGCLATLFVFRKGAQYLSVHRKRNEQAVNDIANSKCYVCNAALDADAAPTQGGVVACAGCTNRVCATPSCAEWQPTLGTWNCRLCNSFMRGSQTACDWFMERINQRLLQQQQAASTEVADERSTTVQLTWNEDETLVVPIEQRDVVRDYIEKLVASMLDGGGDASLDRVPIGQLKDNPSYINIFCVFHLPLSRLFNSFEKSIHLHLCLPQLQSHAQAQQPPPDETYENLKRLVEQIIEQVFKLPELLDHSGVPGRPHVRAAEFDPKKYEELLATAVLNKIVEKFEREQKLLRDRREWQENPAAWDARQSPTNASDCSSTDEPRSDSSSWCNGQSKPMSLNVNAESPKHNDSATLHSPTSDEEYLSDYIQNHRVALPQFDADTTLENGERENGDNWLFKKRNGNADGLDDEADDDLVSITNASSIGMLVPSPTEEVKTLIGDQTADEVSDLSEAGSDVESDLSDAEDDQLNNHVDIPHVIVESRTLIGGKNEVESFDPTLLSKKKNATMESVVVDEPQHANGNGTNEITICPVPAPRKNSIPPLATSIASNDASSLEMHVKKDAEPTIENSHVNNVELKEFIEIEAINLVKEIVDKIVNEAGSTEEFPVSDVTVVKSTSDELLSAPAAHLTESEVIDVAEHSGVVLETVENDSIKSIESNISTATGEPKIHMSADVNTENLIQPDEKPKPAVVCLIETQSITHQTLKLDSDLLIQPADSIIDDPITNTSEIILESEIITPVVVNVESVIVTPQTSNYECKVTPTEYDIKVDEVTIACPQTTSENDEQALIGQIIPDDELVEDTTVPKAILISTKPALVALDLASVVQFESGNEPVGNVVQTTTKTSEDVSAQDDNVLEKVTPASGESLLETMIDNVVPIQSTENITCAPLPADSPIKIPVVIVTESSEQSVDIKPARTFVKQVSLEIPVVDVSDNFEHIMKSQGIVSSLETPLSHDAIVPVIEPTSASSDIDSEFVFVSMPELTPDVSSLTEASITKTVDVELIHDTVFNTQSDVEIKSVHVEDTASETAAANLEQIVVKTSPLVECTESTTNAITENEIIPSTDVIINSNIISEAVVVPNIEPTAQTIDKVEIESLTTSNEIDIPAIVHGEQIVALPINPIDISIVPINSALTDSQITKPIITDSIPIFEPAIEDRISEDLPRIQTETPTVSENLITNQIIVGANPIAELIYNSTIEMPVSVEESESNENVVENQISIPEVTIPAVVPTDQLAIALAVSVDDIENQITSHSIPETVDNDTTSSDAPTDQLTIAPSQSVDAPVESDVLYIGAIAEREHKKWEHADADMPGSPYSPEALQSRLTQGQVRVDDITRLVNAQSPSADAEVAALSDHPNSSPSPVSKPDISRYGRDYYINEAKHAAGITPEASPSAAYDWQPATAKSPTSTSASADYELHTATPLYIASTATTTVATTDGSHPPTSSDEQQSSLTSGFSDGSDTTRVYDLHSRQTALLQHDIIRSSRLPALDLPERLVSVTGAGAAAAAATPPHSPIDARLEHRQAAKHYLSERSASFQQLAEFRRAIEKNNQPLSVSVKPLNGAQQYFAKRDAIKSTAIQQHAAMDSVSQRDVEQAMVVEVVAVENGGVNAEAKVDDTIAALEIAAPLVVNDDAEVLTPVERIAVDVVTEEEKVSPQQIEVVESNDVELRPVSEPMEIEAEQRLSYNESVFINKGVIEEDVLPALPSVKALARSFINLNTHVDETPINRPKSLNFVHTHDGDEEEEEGVAPARRISNENGFPRYNQGYHPMEHHHSITARSLSSKVRDELRDSPIAERSGRISPERPLSPVLKRGVLKSNIAFFENLNK